MSLFSTYQSALTYHDFLAKYGSDEHRRRWADFHARVALTGAQKELLASFKRELNVLVMAGAWCGDCVQQCPIFEHFAAASPSIKVRYIDRDADESVKAALSIMGGARVPKDSPRIVAYGTLDELNAAVGLARVFNAERLAEGGEAAARHAWLDEVLKKVQNQIFDLGSELATPPSAAYEGMFRMSEAEVTELERLMDQCQKDLTPLKSFVLPGGGPIQGFLHQARTEVMLVRERHGADGEAQPQNQPHYRVRVPHCRPPCTGYFDYGV